MLDTQILRAATLEADDSNRMRTSLGYTIFQIQYKGKQDSIKEQLLITRRRIKNAKCQSRFERK